MIPHTFSSGIIYEIVSQQQQTTVSLAKGSEYKVEDICLVGFSLNLSRIARLNLRDSK